MDTEPDKRPMLDAAAEARSVIAFTVDKDGVATAWDYLIRSDRERMCRVLSNLLDDWSQT